jgi:toxin-antitoxin system PIN domain toxin
VILVDANLLVYAFVRQAREHDAARAWLDDRLSEPAQVGLPWPSLLAFVRLVTNPRVCERPVRVAVAWDQVEHWLAAEPAWIPLPTERHAATLGALLLASGKGANLVPDAHLAALAIEHGLTLCSSDSDFARFRGLRWVDPLGGG